MRDCAAVARQLSDTQLVAVLDREVDVQALFAEKRQLQRVELLVRARHNRSLGPDQPKLFDHIRSQLAQPLREARTARAEVRWQTVELPPPPAGRPSSGSC